jgi:hypothetical protein
MKREICSVYKFYKFEVMVTPEGSRMFLLFLLFLLFPLPM